MTFDNGGNAGAATALQFTIPADLTVQGNAIAIATNSQTLGNLLVRSNSSIVIAATNLATMTFVIQGNATIEQGGTIPLDGRGYSQNSGPGGAPFGSGTVGGGGGHAGYGGLGRLETTTSAGGGFYDSITSPNMPGSGGRGVSSFAGGAGGGAVKWTVSGNLRLDGSISANGVSGVDGVTGGGSGGSIWLNLGGFSGAGTLSANGGGGGVPYGGGGSGGCIAVFYNSNSFAGSLVARGGSGAAAGAAGTIYTRGFNGNGNLIVDNGGLAGTNTPLTLNTLDLLTIGGGASLTSSVSTLTLSNLSVGANSALLAGGNPAFTLTLSNATLAGGSVISLNGSGVGGAGAGQASSIGSGGGGNGGYGGNGFGGLGGTGFGSSATPTSAGGQGGSAFGNPNNGGGVLKMTVTGLLQLDGSVTANGLSTSTNSSGGGAGGSVWLSAGRLAGAGLISADGGAGQLPTGGGGGGGRLAIYCASNLFTGLFSAKGGAGYGIGGAGTIYLNSSVNGTPSFTADNGGLPGTTTVLDQSFLSELKVLGGAFVTSSISSSITLSNLTIATNSTFAGGVSSGLTMNLSGSANVGGLLSFDGAGITGSGQGVPSSSGSGGGGNGGYGGRGFGASGGLGSGSSGSPTTAGGRGGNSLGNGINGGGVLRMIVTKSLQVNGRISANGLGTSTNNNGGGAGGSVWLTVGGLSGTGTISADGGSGHLPLGGGGGGGRIAVYWTSNTFAGTFSAKGGAGFGNGGAGTIYLNPNNNSLATLTADNGGLPGAITTFDGVAFQELRILGGAFLTNVSSLSISNLTVGSNSILMAGSFSSTTFNLTGSATIAGLISFDGNSSSGSGQGQTASAGSGGGGHGGYGGRGLGAVGGAAYDSTTSPTTGGSRGGGGVTAPANGGGALHMTVNKLLQLNGRISANGSPGATNSGGGSGGSVWLTLGGLSGAGSISADGGAGNLPANGGGGGGRIAVTYTSNSFTGTFSARGGAGFGYGGAGTVYLKANSSQTGNLIVDNGGNGGTNTLTDAFSSLSSLVVSGGSSLASSFTSLTLGNLTIGANSSLLLGSFATFTVTGGASVAPGGAISADGGGTSGSGTGALAPSGSGGGGHGGYGGNGFGAIGGVAFDSAVFPTQFGGRGGSVNGTGPNGGGALRMTVNGLLQVDGRISANGLDIVSNNAGGGAGGSVYLTVGGLSGAGRIVADGGAGNLPAGGGGGGGRVALYYGSNSFAGIFSAKGGAGFVRGGAGTIYTKANTNAFASVLLDNGGLQGTNTSVSASGNFDVTVQGGAAATSLGNPRDLLVHSNGWVAQTGLINVSRNATLEAGGGIVVDGLGSDPTGTGYTSTTQAGGGGHGGYGGGRFLTYGAAYDFVKSPTRNGGAGGNGSGTQTAPFGGAGGGAIHVLASTLQVDGIVSANGADGNYNSGGGAGGSVWLSVGTLSGSGAISARGGSGNNSGGGGAGGRVALNYNTNLFAGSVSACGGSGFEVGGAGTMYFKTNQIVEDRLVVDNCGLQGSSTPLSQSSGVGAELSVRGAGIAELQGQISPLSNVTISASGVLTGSASDTNIYLIVLGDMVIGTGASMEVDGKGYVQAVGAGPGNSLSNQGAGGGYGGAGGASSSGAAGGITYGSAAQPVDRGSGGGFGLGPTFGGSTGGGAIRLAVEGQLIVDGMLTANGTDGFQDNSGGGAGGSIWVTARTFAGNGFVTANGGAGEPFNGGGGGGGRIAVYSLTNHFTGPMLAAGGPGASSGGSGTVLVTNIPAPQVTAQVPQDIVLYAVSNVDFTFGSLMNSLTASAGDFVLDTPNGLLSQSSITVSALDLTTLRISFPPQDTIGYYEVHAGPQLEDIYGLPMSGEYIGSFVILPPMISGRVTDTNGLPVSFVTIHAGTGLQPAVTDPHGAYSLEVPPSWTGTLTPSKGAALFIPSARDYANVGTDLTNQNFVLASAGALTIIGQQQGSNFKLSYFGISGITYQLLYSTNLVDWLPYGDPFAGTNGPAALLVPTDNDPVRFFRLNLSN